MTVYGIEKVKELYERHDGDPVAIAEELGIKPTSASMLLRRYGLRPAKTSARTKVTEEVLKEMLRRFRNGERITDIARAMGLADSTVSWHLGRAGAYTPGSLVRRNDLTEEKLRRLLDEMDGNVAAVTRRVGASTATIYRYMRMYGIDPDEYREVSYEYPSSRPLGLSTDEVVKTWEENGRFISATAKALGVNRNTVRHHLNKAGVHAAQGA